MMETSIRKHDEEEDRLKKQSRFRKVTDTEIIECNQGGRLDH